MRVKQRTVRQLQEAIQSQNVHRIVDSHGHLNLRHCPLKLDSYGPVEYSVCGIEQRGSRVTHPVGKKPTRSKIKKAHCLHSSAKWNAILRIRSPDYVGACWERG